MRRILLQGVAWPLMAAFEAAVPVGSAMTDE
jgi:hypothetical protein